MKQNKKWVAIILLIVVAFALTACGEQKEAIPGGSDTALVGVWAMEKETLMDFVGLTEESYEQAMEQHGNIGMSYEFTADGKLYLYKITGSDKQLFLEGVYTVDGNQIIVDNEAVAYQLDGNKLTIEGGTPLHLIRQ